MRNPANMKLRTAAVMGLLLLGVGGQVATAQSVPQQLNDLRKQVSQPSQPAPAASQSKPPSPAQPAVKPQANSPAPAANKSAPAKPATPAVPQAQAKTQSQTQAKAPSSAVPGKPDAAKPAAAKALPVKPGAAPAAATAQAKPGQPPVKVVNVKPGPTELSPKAQPAAATTKTVAAPAAKPKVVPAVAEVPEVSHVARRDPFDPLVGKVKETAGGGPQGPLPAGKPGLVVATLRVDGIVKGTGGMIAIVSNPSMRVYFLREGDHLYDGAVEHITMEGVSFHENGKDAFGKPVEREVTKRLYPTPGEQQ